ncbi:MAG: hypothetical protein ABI895_24110 [Deltaproteobacteria bacterium]
MNTQNRNLWPAIGCFLIANTLGIGVVGAQTVPATARQLVKPDARFIVKPGTPNIRELDPSVVIGPVTGCPALLMTGCSSSSGGLFSPLLGGVLPGHILRGGNPLLDASARYDR